MGFMGAWAPGQVFLEDEVSFRNQRLVNGILIPNGPVRPPIALGVTPVGPEDLDVTIPAGVSPGVYVVVLRTIGNAFVPSSNELDIP
jgi:hypothetical protein